MYEFNLKKKRFSKSLNNKFCDLTLSIKYIEQRAVREIRPIVIAMPSDHEQLY